MMNCILFFFKTTLSRVFMEKAGMNIIYRHHLRGPALCDIRHLKPSIGIPKVKNLTTFPTTTPPLSTCTSKDFVGKGERWPPGHWAPDLSVLNHQSKNQGPSFPACFLVHGEGVLTPGPCPGHNRASLVSAILQSPLLNSRKLANH